MKMNKRPIAIFDLDGVLAEYHGFGDGEIGNPLALGIELAEKYHNEGFKIVVQSCRTSFGSVEKREEQTARVQSWLTAHLPIAELYLGEGKAHGHVYFDDRGTNVPMNWENVRNNSYVFDYGMRIAREAGNQDAS